MYREREIIQDNNKQSVARTLSKKNKSAGTAFHFEDNRQESITQMKLQEAMNCSPRVIQSRAFQTMTNGYASQHSSTIQKKENNTGLPNDLKTGVENLSGYSMDDVKVHYNSDKPAQLQAHAYAQGTDIHLASGQEKHLPHEAWHVVQQKQGRVQPTLQMKGNVNINDDRSLEKEADEMGAKSLNHMQEQIQFKESNSLHKTGSFSDAIQRMEEDEILSRRFYKVKTKRGEMVLYLAKIILKDFTTDYVFQPGKQDQGETLIIDDPRDVLEPAASPVIEPPEFSNTLLYDGPKGYFERFGNDLYGKRPSIEGGHRLGKMDKMDYVPYFGPFTNVEQENEQGTMFWLSNEDIEGVDDVEDLDLIDRLKLTPKLISEGFDQMDPELWEELRLALEAQLKNSEESDEESDEEVLEESSNQQIPVGRKKRQSLRLRKTKPTGIEAGKIFVEQYVPMKIAGTNPKISLIKEGAKIINTKRSFVKSKIDKKPGYVLEIPAHISKNVNQVLSNYGDQATRGSIDGRNRIAAVVAINDREPLEPNDKVKIKVNSITKDQGFPYAILGFYWAPEYNFAGREILSFDQVRARFLKEDNEAQNYIKNNLFKNPAYTNQEHLPYGLFREVASINYFASSFVVMLSKYCSPVYIHIGDPDAISWVSNNDEDKGVLTRYDEVLENLGKKYAPPMITGGYNLGTVKEGDSPEERLVRLGNTADRSLRRSIASVVPEVLYATEPNLLVKAFDEEDKSQFAGLKAMQTPGIFGKKAAEGEALRKNLAELLDQDPKSFDFAVYVDNTIETEIPDRILESAGMDRREGSELLNITDQVQSYLNTTFWPGIPRETDYGRLKSNIKLAITTKIASLLKIKKE